MSNENNHDLDTDDTALPEAVAETLPVEQAQETAAVAEPEAAVEPEFQLADETAEEAAAEQGRRWGILEETNPDHVRREFATEREPKNWDIGVETLPIPPGTREAATNALNAMPNVRVLDRDPAAEEFRAYMTNSSRLIAGTKALDDIDRRADSDWNQTVRHEKTVMGAMRPQLGEAVGNKLTGDNAIQHVRAVLGMGSMIRIPLWHSGIWITLRAPTDSDLLELERRLSEDKIEIGRRTFGALYNNECVFYDNTIFQFAMDNLFDSTLADKTEIASKIKVHDLQTIAWGLACAIWPQGFQYARPVMNERGDYTTVKALLNVTKLQWIDRRSLTERQNIHMTKRNAGGISDEALKNYTQDFTRTATRRYPLNEAETVFMELTVPSVAEYFDSGMRWINDIVISNDRVFGENQSVKSRDEYLYKQTNATIMRQYAHWVSKIVTVQDDGAGNTTEREIEDRDSIESLLNDLSIDDDISIKYFNAITKYINDTTISMIAVPTLCEADEVKALPNFPRLIPLNAMEVFFILLVQRTQRISTR